MIIQGMRVSNGFNLYIDISKACNADCKFCIAPIVGRSDTGDFWGGLDYALDLVAKVDGTVQIVGGEPMISKRLPLLLARIGKRNIRRSVLNTNGSRLDRAHVQMLSTAGLCHLNISRHHYDEKVNQQIMEIRPMVSNAEVALAVALCRDFGIVVRLQCNLLPDRVDDISEMFSYLEWAEFIGCKDVSFSQVFPLGLFDYQVPEYPGFTEGAQINLRGLVEAIHSAGISTAIPDATREGHSSDWGRSNWISAAEYGTGGKRRFWSYRGMQFSIKTLAGYDFSGMPLPTVYDKTTDWELQEDVLAFAVLHSDGLVSASWDKAARPLFDPIVKDNLHSRITIHQFPTGTPQ